MTTLILLIPFDKMSKLLYHTIGQIVSDFWYVLDRVPIGSDRSEWRIKLYNSYDAIVILWT